MLAPSDINVLALVKGDEQYVFVWEDGQLGDAMKTLGRFASNPELSFSWYDAAVLSERMKDSAKPLMEPEEWLRQQGARK